jgi:hypothetical protein
MDLPEISLEMMTTFMYNGKFADYEQHIPREADDQANKNCPICPAAGGNSAAAGSCPECEACSSSSAEGDIQPEDTHMIEVPLEVVGVVSVTLTVLGFTTLCACFYCCFCRNSSRSKVTAVPQYDLELPRSGYADNFDDDDKIPVGESS